MSIRVCPEALRGGRFGVLEKNARAVIPGESEEFRLAVKRRKREIPRRTARLGMTRFWAISRASGGLRHIASLSCCYNVPMTLIEITYELQSSLTTEQLRALGSFANTYGLRRFRVDEKANRLSFEYDASRLKETEVAHVLRQANIPVVRRVEPTATVAQL
jgi:hypothetical protein